MFVKVQGLSRAERSLLLVTPQLLLHVILMSSFHWPHVKSCLVFTHFDLSRAIGPRQRPRRRRHRVIVSGILTSDSPQRGSARLCFQRTPMVPLRCINSLTLRPRMRRSLPNAVFFSFSSLNQYFTPADQLAEGMAVFWGARDEKQELISVT